MNRRQMEGMQSVSHTEEVGGQGVGAGVVRGPRPLVIISSYTRQGLPSRTYPTITRSPLCSKRDPRPSVLLHHFDPT